MVSLCRLSLSLAVLTAIPCLAQQITSSEETQNRERDLVVDKNNQLVAYLDTLNPEELQILNNIVYLLYANSVLELQAQQFFVPLTRLVQEINTKVRSYENPSEQLATLKKLTERLTLIAGARTIYNETLKQCLMLCDSNKDNLSRITPVTNFLQTEGQTAIVAWANNNKNDNNTTIASCSDVLQDGARFFTAASGFLKGLSEGQLPAEINENLQRLPAEAASNLQAINGVNVFLQGSTQATASLENLLAAITDKAKTPTESLLTIAHDVYKNYYTILHSHVTAKNCDKKYKTILFSMYGMLPEEHRSKLPKASQMLKHILKTVKLYTQTEVSPS